jgi:cob(I)alamin adenosyltransferase
MNKIYTKTGDKGTTGTLKGRISKSNELAIALGTVDELNSNIGVVRGYLIHDLRFISIDKELHNIQNNLLNLGSSLAGSELKISATETKKLEKLIDKLTADLPKLSNFIFPTGPTPVGQLHVARTVARRAERAVIAAEISDKNILSYLNRLSDALFTIARWVNMKLRGVDEVWNK